MSVKIRLTKTGKRNQIQYRIVAQDTRTKRDGKFLEILGYFNPFASKNKLTLKKEGYDAWIKKGAKPTPSLSYLIQNGKLPKKTKKVRADAKTQDQKAPESNQQITETPIAEEIKQPDTQELKVEPESTEENPNPAQDENPKADDTKEVAKA